MSPASPNYYAMLLHLTKLNLMKVLWQTYSISSAAAFFMYSTLKALLRDSHLTLGSSSRLMFSVGGANSARNESTNPSSSAAVRNIMSGEAVCDDRSQSRTRMTHGRVESVEEVKRLPLSTFHYKSWQTAGLVGVTTTGVMTVLI